MIASTRADPVTARGTLRREIRRLRKSLGPTEQRACAKALARNLMGAVRLRRSERIGCYLAQDGELDLAPVMERLRNLGRQLYLPVLRGPQLWFMPLGPQTRLVKNRFGILEPDAPGSARCAPQAMDFVLAPLVAFDDQGRRLGMGGGYYDRTFAYLLNRQYWRRPHLIGIAYDLQRVPVLRACEWDVPLDGIATESGLRFFRSALNSSGGAADETPQSGTIVTAWTKPCEE